MTLPTGRLDLDPAPEVWLLGPTEERPLDVWLPQAVAVMSEFLDVTEEEPTLQTALTMALERFATDDSSPLAYRLLRWRSRDEAPLPLFVGMVPRAVFEPEAEDWLSAADQATVEPASVEEVAGPPGSRTRRSLAYSSASDDPTALVVGLRYVVDVGDPELLALAHTASYEPAQLLDALTDIEDLLRTVTVTSAPDTGTGA